MVGRILSAAVTPFVAFDLPSAADGPGDAPIVWAPNHRSMFDAAVGLIGLYRMGYTASFFVNATYFEKPVVGRLLEIIGAVPVQVDRGALKAISVGVEHLRAGRSLVIMAEGRLVRPEDRCNGIGALEPGVMVLARRASVPVVPVALVGTDVILPIGARRPRIGIGRRRLVLVRFGRPLSPGATSRAALVELSEQLGRLVREAEAEHPLFGPRRQDPESAVRPRPSSDRGAVPSRAHDYVNRWRRQR